MPAEEFKANYKHLKQQVEILEIILNNLRKGINRKLTIETIFRKKDISRTAIKEFFRTIRKIERKFKLSENIRNKLDEKIRAVRQKIKFIFTTLREKEKAETEIDIEIASLFNTNETNNNMTEIFKYSEARHLPELRTVDSHTTVRDFIASIKGYHDLLVAAGQISLIKFVLATKIQGEAKTKIGAEEVDSLTELTTLLNEKCSSTDTQATLLKKLNESKQGDQTVEKFAEAIKNLTNRLTALEVRKLGLTPAQAETVAKIYDSQALGAFKKGLKTSCQAAVCAARPETLADAIVVASEISVLVVINENVNAGNSVPQNWSCISINEVIFITLIVSVLAMIVLQCVQRKCKKQLEKQIQKYVVQRV
jgi:hypothetical protein